METLTYDRFLDEYKPIKNEIVEDAPFDGYMFETYGRELKEIKNHNPSNVWTLLDVDGELFLAAGIHFVNRLGFFITEKEWESSELEFSLEDDLI